jgi:ribosomal protein L7Ae-like RNA K-turn-binding protein
MNNGFLQFLGLTKRSGKILEGYNKCEDSINIGKIKLLIISKDCSQNTKEKFIGYSKNNNIDLIECYNGEMLGKALGREEVNIIGILDSNMSKKLIKLWEQDKTI